MNAALGLMDGDAARFTAGDASWIYFDHAYFQRGWEHGNFRVVRDGVHLTRVLDRPKDRMERMGVVIEPWRKSGTEIVVIPPQEWQAKYYGNADWVGTTLQRLDAITDRPVSVKWGKLNSLREYCANAWAVVTYASVAGVEASLMGIPVFSTPACPSWPCNAGPLENIESPVYAENRAEMAASLAYASWNDSELDSIDWNEYHYSLCES